jgi:hypothetical protein
MQPSTVQPGQGDEALLHDIELETSDSDSIHMSDPQTQSHQSADTLPDSPLEEEEEEEEEEEIHTLPPLMHFPNCRLDITTITASDLPASVRDNLTSSSIPPECKFERVALPGSLVRTLLSRFDDQISRTTTTTQPRDQPQAHPHPQQKPAAAKKERKEEVQTIQRHFDDGDEWVYSRCLLADYTNFREDEAEVLSEHGRLCCWASVLLRPLPLPHRSEEEEEGEGEGGSGSGDGRWELEFVVQRVGVRDPESGWCGCF